MTAVKAAKADAQSSEAKSALGRTVIYSHCSAVDGKLEHSAESAGVIINERPGGLVDIDCTASNGKRFVVEQVPHVSDVKTDKTAKHAYRFTSR